MIDTLTRKHINSFIINHGYDINKCGFMLFVVGFIKYLFIIGIKHSTLNIQYSISSTTLLILIVKSINLSSKSNFFIFY